MKLSDLMPLATAVLTVALAIAAAPAARAQAPENSASYLVTYLEVTPSAEASAISLLRQVAAASRKEPGNLRYEILQATGRPAEFAILEAWSDAKSHEAHSGGAAMKQFRAGIDPLRIGYYDERLDTGIDVGTQSAPAGKDAIYVVTHVDVTGQFKDDAIALMKTLAADSRREPGSLRFEVWDQNNRLNHFTMTETWKDQAALDAHNAAAPAKTFREKVGHMMGALYDDRRYRNLE
ncbi:MAG TPA: antibiotic biosynthesis monooxygenase [Xanthobacteraceae bacterium]|nr:antibiotic biosynthesis monooxygenase [Xanthobacteraceae bacterium]